MDAISNQERDLHSFETIHGMRNVLVSGLQAVPVSTNRFFRLTGEGLKEILR
jgi:hypothetical protein